MGIHGIFKEIGPGQRISLAKLSSDHFTTHGRPLRLAIDTAIWLFQIQAGKGGSNPALRTFYYRLLRLMSFNIHPLFVFDGPNKPLFKRNKRVGGPGVRVASVPEFLAKQLLKHFGFPWHVAPGEAEAECALLQREGIVDAVLSEDVDTLMFGSGVTLKNWSPENTSKTPTHVNVYRAEETKEKSGLDREGMILVALMSGGDYITEGIPGAGPKVACDAARAGFAKDLIDAASRKDTSGLKNWRETLQHQIRTNEGKHFSRRNTKLIIPEDFPNHEVLGYYTHPCVSTAEKLAKLRETLKWDQEIDFVALRSFAADAFDWRCLGGAKKFIRNLAPAMLVRELRLRGDEGSESSPEAQEVREREFVMAVHSKRHHSTTDGELEYRISFVALNLVSIDLSIEDEEDDFIPAGGADEQSDAENELVTIPTSTANEAPGSPSKKRTVKPYHPDQPEKIWMVHSFLKAGCPLLVEDYEGSLRDPKALLKARRKARVVTAGDANIRAKRSSKKSKTKDMPQDAITRFTTVTKYSQSEAEPSGDAKEGREPLKTLHAGANVRSEKREAAKTKKALTAETKDIDDVVADISGFKLPSTQMPAELLKQIDHKIDGEVTPKARRQAGIPFERARSSAEIGKQTKKTMPHKSPQRRKRSLSDVASPALSQRSIVSYFSPSPKKTHNHGMDIINLSSSSPMELNPPRALTPTPTNVRTERPASSTRDSMGFSPGKLPESITKRRKKGPLKRTRTAPLRGIGDDDCGPILNTRSSRPSTPEIKGVDFLDAIDLASPSTAKIVEGLTPNPRTCVETIPMPNFTKAQGLEKPKPRERHKSTVVPPSSSALVISQDNKRPPKSSESSRPSSSTQNLLALRRSPRQQAKIKKKRLELRESLPGTWREVEIETLDMTGDNLDTLEGCDRKKVRSWRQSGVQLLDLTDI